MSKQPSSWNNVIEMFFDQAEALGDKPFLWSKRQDEWQAISWTQAADRVARLAGALRGIGIKRGDRVVIVSENRPEWCIFDLAIMTAGGITVPAYTTNTENDHDHILENSGAKFAVVSTPRLARALLPAVYQSDRCNTVIGIDPLRMGQSSTEEMYDYEALVADSSTSVAEARAMADFKREDLACLIYTSGTGGAPRGVRQHHGALLHNVQGGVEIIHSDFPRYDDVFLSFLPLSHAYEHTMGQFFAIALGGETYYAEGLDKLAKNIEEVRPTVLVVVPRLFEVLRSKIMREVEKGSAVKRTLFDAAQSLGRKRGSGDLSWYERPVDAALDKLVRDKVRAKFGGRNKALVSGGAPLNPEVGDFFSSLGLTLLQGYGQTEAAPLISCNRPAAGIKMNTVGPPVPHTEVMIAQDGEILVRGELVMHGYWNNDEESMRVLRDGWLHTGDVGHIDEDGHIVITDRKKDIIVNDKGDNVSPQRVEGMLTLEPEILQAMVYGDKKPYLVGLVTPDPEWAAEWVALNGADPDPGALAANADYLAQLQTAVDRVNKRLSVLERVRRIIVTDEPFSVDNEQMTPTLKIRRHVIKGVYGERLLALYK